MFYTILCSRPHIHHASFNGAVLSKHAEARSSHPVVFLGKGTLKIYSKFTGEHPYWSAISIKLESNFIEITFRHRCSPVNFLQIFKTPFRKNPTGCLLRRSCANVDTYPNNKNKFFVLQLTAAIPRKDGRAVASVFKINSYHFISSQNI